MKRRTLDVLLSLGGLVLAVLLFVGSNLTVGARDYLQKQVTFGQNFMREQLAAQQITFKNADALTAEERTVPGLVENAGKQMLTGEQAKVQADIIGLHMSAMGSDQVVDTKGHTYAQLGDDAKAVQAKIADAKVNNPDGVADLNKRLTEVNSQRDTVFKGETLRGVLLSAYGFGVIADSTKQGVNWSNDGVALMRLAAAVLLLLSLAGFWHARRTPPTVAVAPVQPERVPVRVVA